MLHPGQVLKGSLLLLSPDYYYMGIKINADETRYMVTGKSTISFSTFSIGCCSSQKVKSCVFFGSLVNCEGDFTVEGKERLVAANKCYFGLVKCLGPKLLSRKFKCHVDKTLFAPVAPTCGSENWAVSEQGQNVLRSFEGKVLCKTFGTALEYQCWGAQKTLKYVCFMTNMMWFLLMWYT